MIAEAWSLIEWWKDWRDFQMLPFPGTMADQPCYVAEVIRRCQATYDQAVQAYLNRGSSRG